MSYSFLMCFLSFIILSTAPSAVSIMHQVSRAVDSITLSWSQPDQPNGVILDYELQYYEKVILPLMLTYSLKKENIHWPRIELNWKKKISLTANYACWYEFVVLVQALMNLVHDVWWKNWVQFKVGPQAVYQTTCSACDPLMKSLQRNKEIN